MNDAYSKLNKEYIEAQRNAKNLAAAHGTTNKAAQEAAKHAKGLSDELKKIDNTVGQNQLFQCYRNLCWNICHEIREF